MLKKTRVELELISDHEVFEFFESQMRGGVSTVFHRYAEANNKYLDSYDSEKPSSYIAYLDANNLYGWAISKALPTGNFKFLKVKEKEEIFKQLKMERGYTPLESKGRVFEVDLEYPQELHDYHDDYPFLPERLNDKLIPNLLDKKYYQLNVHNLIQALKHGLRLIRIHRVLEIDQTSWLKSYIDFNTNLRAQSKNTFEKDFFKLMNNAVFGETVDNIRNRCNLQILNNNTDILSCKNLNSFISKPNYKKPIMIPQSDINIFPFTKTVVEYNQPIYVGAQILDLSKTLMYDFHYEYMKPKWTGLKTLYTDTHSIIYWINCEDFYKDISEDINKWFDTSGYSESKGEIKLGVNKKVIGKFIDEMGDQVMSHFCANRFKSYSYKLNGEEVHNVLKGIVKVVRNKMINFEDYRRCVFDQKIKDIKQARFEVKKSYFENSYNKKGSFRTIRQ